ncbi:MAG TPA: M23 family metallopeptidase [Ferruginibacter sp.]|nr:M23 family metallopeptidase [Ferruginibacter sp.]
MIKKSQRPVFFILLMLTVYCSPAQIFPANNYPRGYFIWPLDLNPEMVANFGELRANHYHMGLDCRTAQKQNLPVYAVADGYIARIKIEPSGFGRAIYINHPNGFTTLYAHLNDFFPELESYVKEQQYKLKSWSVDLSLPPALFPVEKCRFIAYSGNTGASQGPHVHFEIRDTKTEKVLNPSLFGMPLPDTLAPAIYRLAVYDRNLSTYEQTPKLYPLKKLNGIYITNPPVIEVTSDKVSFGITASDRCNGSANSNGIYEAVLYENGIPATGFQMDNIGYDETRYLNAHIDYRLRSSGGPYIQHLSQLPGYKNGIYKNSGNDVMALNDSSTRPMRITVKDADGNSSDLVFEIKRNIAAEAKKEIAPLADNDRQWFAPGLLNVFENDNILFYLPPNCLYDSFRFVYSESIPKQGYPVYQLHNTTIPLHSYFPVSIKTTVSLPGKMVMHRFANGRHDYAKADPVKTGKEEGWFRAYFREFGSFQMMIDTIPPVIAPIGFKNGMKGNKLKQLVFAVTDNTEEVKNFTATLDGNWLRFSNDKGRRFVYSFDEMCAPGEHELKIIAEDQVGNVTTKIYQFTR